MRAPEVRHLFAKNAGLPMIRGLLARYPLKRVVLIADRGLLSTANIEELDKLQAQLKK
jgi:hypothetical protein